MMMERYLDSVFVAVYDLITVTLNPLHLAVVGDIYGVVNLWVSGLHA